MTLEDPGIVEEVEADRDVVGRILDQEEEEDEVGLVTIVEGVDPTEIVVVAGPGEAEVYREVEEIVANLVVEIKVVRDHCLDPMKEGKKINLTRRIQYSKK